MDTEACVACPCYPQPGCPCLRAWRRMVSCRTAHGPRHKLASPARYLEMGESAPCRSHPMLNAKARPRSPGSQRASAPAPAPEFSKAGGQAADVDAAWRGLLRAAVCAAAFLFCGLEIPLSPNLRTSNELGTDRQPISANKRLEGRDSARRRHPRTCKCTSSVDCRAIPRGSSFRQSKRYETQRARSLART